VRDSAEKRRKERLYMRKTILVLMLLVFAADAWAGLAVTCTSAGSTVTVSYSGVLPTRTDRVRLRWMFHSAAVPQSAMLRQPRVWISTFTPARL